MIGRHVAHYTPRFWHFRALPAAFGNRMVQRYAELLGIELLYLPQQFPPENSFF